MTRISEQDFEMIVNDIASNNIDIKNVVCEGYTATITFLSNSSKGTWDLNFDLLFQDGEPSMRYWDPYNSLKASSFVETIRRTVKEFINS